MSKEFIEKRYNSSALDEASRQQKQLSYFTVSEVQEDIRSDYFEKYVESKYYTNDVFLNWAKVLLKNANFLSLAKFYRNPNPSAKLINTRIKEPLSRVFFSEDSYFNYVINGNYVDHPIELEDGFEERLFNAVLFSHNDIVVHDLYDINKPYREFVGIDKITSIKVDDRKIEKLAYTAHIEVDGEKVYGFAYLDDKKYEFYNKDYDLIKSVPHDFGMCPATFVVSDRFYPEGHEHDPEGIVKLSIFSHVRSELEEYTFLRTLQKITDTHGAFPIYTKIKTKELSAEGDDFSGISGEPMGADNIGSQASREARSTAGSKGGIVMQPGTEIELPPIEKLDGSIDMEFPKHFINYFHAPVGILKFMDGRINDCKEDILVSTIGNYSDRNDVSMTELQAKKGLVSIEDKLRWLSKELSFSRRNSDTMMLSLAYGRNTVKCDVFYGSDFFLETQDRLYDMIKKTPNPIETKNLLVRISQRRNMFNKEKQKREVILYKLLPYSTDAEFAVAIAKGNLDDTIFEFQSRFNFWIAHFESFYGDLTAFWNSMNAKESEKVIVINNQITKLIQTNTNLKTQTNGKETDS
jgi:hypothetical protein